MQNEIMSVDYWVVDLDQLNAYEEFSSFVHPEKKEITDFIQHAYNIESLYVKKYESRSDRLNAVSKHIKINDVDVAEYLTIENCPKQMPLIDDMISCYLSKIQNNHKFELYITYQSLFSEYCHRLRSKVPFGVDEDKALKAMETKVKITQPASDLINVISKLRMEIFGDNKKSATHTDKKVAKTPEYYASLKK